MTLDLSHLTAPTRELAFQDTKARIRLVQTVLWVAYPRAGVAVDAAEDLTPAEEQEGEGMVGRFRRMSVSEYGEHQITRTLRDVVSPKVRGAALWAAHALMATCHSAASDRPSGPSSQDRQAAWISRSAPAARHWLAERQESWPTSYSRKRWIEVRELT